MIARSRSNKPPKNWWQYHTRDCGTKYRGCSPDCPKDIYERTGEWKDLYNNVKIVEREIYERKTLQINRLRNRSNR